jgi:hypothetical protein
MEITAKLTAANQLVADHQPTRELFLESSVLDTAECPGGSTNAFGTTWQLETAHSNFMDDA